MQWIKTSVAWATKTIVYSTAKFRTVFVSFLSRVSHVLLPVASKSRARCFLLRAGHEQTLAWLRACHKHGTYYYEQVTSRLCHITCMLRLITNMLRSCYVLLRTSNYEQIRTISRLITSKSEPDNILLRANQTRSRLTTSRSRPYHKHVANKSWRCHKRLITNRSRACCVWSRTDHYYASFPE